MELAVISPYTLQPHNHPNPRRYSHSHHPPHPRPHPHHARSAKVNCWPWFRARGCPSVLGYCSHFHCWLCHHHHHPVFDETKKFVRFRDLFGTKLFQTTFFQYKHYPRPILRLFRYYFFRPVPFRTYIQAFVSLLITITVPIPPKNGKVQGTGSLETGTSHSSWSWWS